MSDTEKKKKKYRTWSGEDRQTLRSFKAHVPLEEQARILGRPVSHIRNQRNYLGLKSAISEKKMSREHKIARVYAAVSLSTFEDLRILAEKEKKLISRYVRDVLIKHVLYKTKGQSDDEAVK